MPAVPVLPDAERLAVEYLRAQPDVAALVAGRVSTELPASPAWPLIRVVRIGGTPKVPRRLDGARLQVEAWATTKTQARLVAATAQAALAEMAGAYAAGVVTGTEDDLGLTWVPDTESTPPRPRYLFGAVIYAHPA